MPPPVWPVKRIKKVLCLPATDRVYYVSAPAENKHRSTSRRALLTVLHPVSGDPAVMGMASEANAKWLAASLDAEVLEETVAYGASMACALRLPLLVTTNAWTDLQTRDACIEAFLCDARNR